MTVPRTLRLTVRSQPNSMRAERGSKDTGAVLGPRQGGQQRSITVLNGQPRTAARQP